MTETKLRRLTFPLIAALVIAMSRWVADAISALKPGHAMTWLSADMFIVILIGMALLEAVRTDGAVGAVGVKSGLRIAVASLALGIATAFATVAIAAWRVVNF